MSSNPLSTVHGTDRICRARPRAWQFRLRTLLALSLVVALALGWQVNRAARQRRAAVTIRALGGHVYYARDMGGLAMHEGLWNGVMLWVGDHFGRDLIDRVTWVDIEGADLGDDDLAALGDLASLELLRIDSCRITADGLTELASLRRLEVLGLQNHRNVADGLVHLRSLGALRSLVLRDTDTGDEHVDVLCQLTGLENLDLVNTDVTEAGLTKLTKLPQLRNLQLHGTRLTDAAVAEFRQRRPDVRVEY